MKLVHKDHQIPLLALPGLNHSACGCGSQKAAKGEAITVHHLELVHKQVLVTPEQFRKSWPMQLSHIYLKKQEATIRTKSACSATYNKGNNQGAELDRN